MTYYYLHETLTYGRLAHVDGSLLLMSRLLMSRPRLQPISRCAALCQQHPLLSPIQVDAVLTLSLPLPPQGDVLA
jgi:hypothetical protein